MLAAGMALAAGGWALAQSPAQGSGQVPVPTAAQMGMGSQIPAQGQTQNAVLSQDEVRDQVPAHSAPLPHGEGARRMGERLRAIFDGNDWRADPSKPFERIPYYQALLSRKLPLRDEMAVRMELGNEQLRAGRSERAVETLEDLVKVMEPHLAEVPRSIQAQIHQELALAYLRLGEQENCIGMHNALSCNFPLHGGGIHKKTRGAEGAVREYTKALELNPESNLCRWLLNIA
jgi:tetratricopeptide (TPR) repeat protein